MMAMVKIVLLLLVVYKATAVENSREIDSDRELLHYSSSQPSRNVDLNSGNCAVECALECQDKKSFKKALCIGMCLAKCFISPSESLEIACTVDCLQSSTNNLRPDANMMNDRVSSCNQQCKKN